MSYYEDFLNSIKHMEEAASLSARLQQAMTVSEMAAQQFDEMKISAYECFGSVAKAAERYRIQNEQIIKLAFGLENISENIDTVGNLLKIADPFSDIQKFSLTESLKSVMMTARDLFDYETVNDIERSMGIQQAVLARRALENNPILKSLERASLSVAGVFDKALFIDYIFKPTYHSSLGPAFIKQRFDINLTKPFYNNWFPRTFAGRILSEILGDTELTEESSFNQLEDKLTHGAEKVEFDKAKLYCILGILFSAALFLIGHINSKSDKNDIIKSQEHTRKVIEARIESLGKKINKRIDPNQKKFIYCHLLRPVSLREEPSALSKPLDFLHPGQKFRLLRYHRDWALIETIDYKNPSTLVGWIGANNIKILPRITK
ncbi:MAG: SH3 domain-containing protein [Thermodesulfobacteriota bacterium]